jgi:long-chain acyl-CoA synthetase
MNASRGAAALRAVGLREGDRIALLLRNDFAFLEVSVAAALLGVHPVPVNWNLTAEEIAYVLADSDARVIVMHEDLIARVAGILPADVFVCVVRISAQVAADYNLDPTAVETTSLYPLWDEWLAAHEPVHEHAPARRESLFYTSGTSGRPKGVLRMAPSAEQARERQRVWSTVYNLEPDSRVIVPGPLYHAAPNNLSLGARAVVERLVVMPRFDAQELLRLIERHGATTLLLVPTMFVRLLRLPDSVRRQYDLRSLRHVVHAAAPCPPDVKLRMIEWWGPVIKEFYGATETGAVMWCDTQEWLTHPGTVGRCVEGGHIRILDDAGLECSAGEAGRIFLRLDCMPDFQYLHAEADESECKRDGFVATGDIGYVDRSGFLFLCDRERDMVISGGVNIYPAEIEAALHRLPGIRDCAVFGIPDPEFGESLLAAISADPELTEDAIREHLRVHIAGYKIPRRIEFRNDLPRDDNGKLLKRRLRDVYWRDAQRLI